MLTARMMAQHMCCLQRDAVLGRCKLERSARGGKGGGASDLLWQRRCAGIVVFALLVSVRGVLVRLTLLLAPHVCCRRLSRQRGWNRLSLLLLCHCYRISRGLSRVPGAGGSEGPASRRRTSTTARCRVSSPSRCASAATTASSRFLRARPELRHVSSHLRGAEGWPRQLPLNASAQETACLTGSLISVAAAAAETCEPRNCPASVRVNSHLSTRISSQNLKCDEQFPTQSCAAMITDRTSHGSSPRPESYTSSVGALHRALPPYCLTPPGLRHTLLRLAGSRLPQTRACSGSTLV